LPVVLNMATGLTILMAALYEYQRQIEAARVSSEQARVELVQLAARLEQRTVEYAAERDRVKALAASETESHERLQLLIGHAPAALAMFDRQMCYLAVSRRWMLDYALDDQDILGRSHFEVFPKIPERWKAIYAQGLRGEVLKSAEDRFDRGNGTTQWLKWEVRPWLTALGNVGGIAVFSEDITERKNAEDELRIAATAFESQEGIVVADSSGTVLRVNRAFSKLTGYDAQDVIGKSVALLQSGHQDAAFYQGLRQALQSDGYWQGETWNQRKNGDPYAAWVTISTVKGLGDATTHYVGAFADITKNKEAEAQIHNLAYYDPLTQLPNRRLLHERIGQVMGSRQRNSYNGLLFLDLDNFKVLNDTRGHDVGDGLLVEAARRIQASVRGRDTVARLGGDEFVVVLEDLGVEAQGAALHAGAVGEKLRQALARPYDVGERQFHCPASLGVTLFRGNEDTVETVLKHADLAMYQAKNAGRNSLRFFDPAMQTALDERSALEADLRTAVELGQLRLYYQPQMNSARRIVGAEALLRWVHPERGLVPPGDFIPLAEETGLILPIGQWVLETACAQIQAWSVAPAMRDLRLAVNVSARQFRQPEFVALVRYVLKRTGADPTRLKVEITESVVLGDVGDTFAKMNDLKSLGISFSLDDFGTGNSSLSYLSKLPLNELKIDKSFVLNLPDNRNDSIIAQTIITMATSLGLEVIAEGVETEAQRTFLQRHGCNAHQGYLFSRPLPLLEFERFVAGAG
jgi:diguanylate cyclase (GGDEF)-like protein/PAS domain S-box-containing protein